jgi:hypothetical protein
VPIDPENLKGLRGPASEAPRIDRQLPLWEELVLLALEPKGEHLGSVLDACRGAYGQPSNERQVLAALEQGGMVTITRRGLTRRASPTDQAQLTARQRRVMHVIRSQEPLTDDEGDLLVALAASGSLRLHQSDHLRARHRIGSLGQRRPLSPFVQRLCDNRDLRSATALAEQLLPAQNDYSGGFDPGISPVIEAVAGTPGGLSPF